MKKTVLVLATAIGLVTAAQAAEPTTTMPQTTTTPQTTTMPKATTEPAMPSTTHAAVVITRRMPGETMSSALVGAEVHSLSGEKVGDVDDLILSSKGTVDGVVVGVGGFLGMGEKNVAIAYSSLTVTTDLEGKVMVRLDVTKDALKAAPAYVPAAKS